MNTWQLQTPDFGLRASGFYGTPNVVYPMMLIAMFTFAACVRATRNTWLRRGAALMAAGAFLMLILTFSRAGWLGGVGALAVLAAQGRGRRRWACLGLAAALFLGAVFVRTHGGVAGSGADASARNRPAIWRHAVRVWMRSPWLGHGYSAFARQEIVGETPPGLPYLPGEPKNLYLNILVEQGVVGLSLYLVFFGSALRTARRVQARADAPTADRLIAAALYPSLIAILVAGLVDTPAFGPLMRVPGTATLLVFIGMVAGAEADLKRAATKDASLEAS